MDALDERATPPDPDAGTEAVLLSARERVRLFLQASGLADHSAAAQRAAEIVLAEYGEAQAAETPSPGAAGGGATGRDEGQPAPAPEAEAFFQAVVERACRWRERWLDGVIAALPTAADPQTRAMLAWSLREAARQGEALEGQPLPGPLSARLSGGTWIVPPAVRGEMSAQSIRRPQPSRLRKMARQVAALSREALTMIAGR